MATANTENESETLACHICHQQCIGSRKLPQCGHQCCETCILIYVLKLKDQGDLDIGFPCPSCNVINSGPKDLKAAIGWIQSLERGTETMTETVEKRHDMCRCCEVLDRSSKAVKQCLDCAEAFCELCSVSRHTHPTLKEHKVINIDLGDADSGKTSSLFRMLCELTSCDTHPGNPIVFFCNDHEEYGCEMCVDMNHKQCYDVVKANTIAAKEKIEDETKPIKVAAENLCSYANTLIEAKLSDLNANDEQVATTIAKIKAIRETVNRLIDNFEHTATKSAKSTAKKRKTVGHTDIEILENMSESSKKSLLLLEKIVSVGSSYQNDIVIEKLKQQMKTYEDTLLTMSRTFRKIGIVLDEEELVLNLPNIVNDYLHGKATIVEEEEQGGISSYRSGLLLKELKVTKVKDVTLERHGTPSFRYGCTQIDLCSGVVILRNGNIVVNHNEYCYMLQSDGQKTGEINLSQNFSVVETKDSINKLLRAASKKEDLIAIPVPSAKEILLVSTTTTELSVKHVVRTSYEAKALHVMRNADIAVAWLNPVAFGIISVGEAILETKVYFRRDILGREIKTFDFIAVDEKRSHVIQPCTSDKAVYCFDFEGNHNFKYDGVRQPRGVALDGDSNIYVADPGSNALHVISPAGKPIRKIKSSPLAIAFNYTGNEFVVTSAGSSTATTYKFEEANPDVQIAVVPSNIRDILMPCTLTCKMSV